MRSLENDVVDLKNRVNGLENRIIDLGNKVTSLENKIASLENRTISLENRISGLENRITSLENRISRLEDRVSSLENRVNNLEKRVSGLESRMTSLENRVNGLENRIVSLENSMKDLEKRLSSEIRRAFSHVISFTQSIQYMLIDFMSMKGLFTKEEREFLIKDVERIGKLYLTTLNPLKPEEARFILEVMKEIREKDPKEIDLSKLDRIIEIARRWFEEEGHPDAARLMIEAYMLKSILRKERGEL